MKKLLLLLVLASTGCSHWHPVASKQPRFQFMRSISAQDLAAIKASDKEAKDAAKGIVWEPSK